MGGLTDRGDGRGMDQLDSFSASLAFVPMIIRICSPDNLDLFSCSRRGFVLDLDLDLSARDDLHFKIVTSCYSLIDWSTDITLDRDTFYLVIVSFKRASSSILWP